MKTYKNREGKYVSEMPESFFVSLDAHGEEVFTGDFIFDKRWKRLHRVDNENYLRLYYVIQHSVIKRYGLYV